MGDTFPQTFTCQDQRLRSGLHYNTWVQELGRLCRYPAVRPETKKTLMTIRSAAVPAGEDIQEHDMRIELLRTALQEAYGIDWHTTPGDCSDIYDMHCHCIASSKLADVFLYCEADSAFIWMVALISVRWRLLL